MNYEQDPHNDEYEITISIHKPIFHISAVAQMIGIHQQTLRSYEKQGIIRPARSDGNTRLYSVNEIERLRQMLNLVNELGVNLAGAEIILRMREQIEILQDKLNDAKNEITKLKE
jgi:MerR family transcriptional regulator, heat shock protein HspR|tara:strand:+ start:1836 stop:2180 length:345 start_codon:yes stop_codon:yes gene_type:complete